MFLRCMLAAFAKAVADGFQAHRMTMRAVVNAIFHARVAVFFAVVSHRSVLISMGDKRRARIVAPFRLLTMLREGRDSAVVADELDCICLRAPVGHLHARRAGRHAGKDQTSGVELLR